MITSGVARKVKKQVAKATPTDTARKRKKDPSHASFYSGFIRGMLCSLEGIILFLGHPELQQVLKDSIRPLMNAQLAYLALGVLAYVFIKDPATKEVHDAFWVLTGSFWRWGRIISTIVSLILERKIRANRSMFQAALKVKNPHFASEVFNVQSQKVKGEKLIKYVRTARLLAFRIAGAVVAKYFRPNYRVPTMTLIKFLSIRPILGTKMSMGLAAVELLPQDLLMKSFLDDVLVFLGESLLDAYDLGKDSTKYYYKRLASLETREYFRARYHGYLSGSGFLFSFLLGVPFLGVWINLIVECGAACVVLDIVERNADKAERRPLLGENSLRPKIS